MHVSVLAAEVIEGLNPKAGGLYIDGTLGGGGHTRMILERGGRVIGIDQDSDVLTETAARLSDWRGQFTPAHGNFCDMKAILQSNGYERADGILLDLGVSSFQLDRAERGFSFQQDGPLDMRMDRSRGQTAADLVNTLSRDALADLLRDFGEESAAWRIAGAIVQAREKQALTRTGQLAEVVAAAVGGRHGRIHPATKTFQALRIAVNREMECLAQGLKDGLDLLNPGGRMAVIAFHSLEDRQVKQLFNQHAGRMESLPQGGAQWVGEYPQVRKITRKAVTASESEVAENPRSRSAKLRIVERA